MTQTMNYDPVQHLITHLDLKIKLPIDFPDKYKPAIIKAAKLCTVKRHLENPPEFRISTE